MTNQNQLPQPDLKDELATLAKVILSAFPAGGTLSEAMNKWITPSLTKRRDIWFQSLADRIKVLEDRSPSFTLKNLIESDSFLTALQISSSIAFRTHKEKKLEALRNALFNSCSDSLSIDEGDFFWKFLENHSEIHLDILNFFKNPKIALGHQENDLIIVNMPDMVTGINPVKTRPQTYKDWFLDNYKNIFVYSDSEKELLVLAVRELYSQNLITFDLQSQKWDEVYAPKITDLGYQYLRFINNTFIVGEND